MSDMEIENETTPLFYDSNVDRGGGRTMENSEKEDLFLERFSLKEKREKDGRDSKEEPRQKKIKLGDERTKKEGVLNAGVGGAMSSPDDEEINLPKAEIEMMEGKIENMRTGEEDGEDAAKKAVLWNSPDLSPIKIPNEAEVGEVGMTLEKAYPRHSTPITAAAPEEINSVEVLKAKTGMMEGKIETEEGDGEDAAEKAVCGNPPVVSPIMTSQEAEIGGTTPKKGTPKRADSTPTEAAYTPRVNFAITEKGFRVEIKAEMEVVATPLGKSGSPC